MLYCSDGELMAIREVGGEVGDRIAILEMGLTNSNRMPCVFVAGELVHRYRTKRTLVGGKLDALIEQVRVLKLDLKRSLMIDGFYARAFRSRGRRFYPITVAITQDFLSSGHVHRVAYPTVAGPIGLNLALTSEAARQFLAIVSVRIIKLEARVRDTFKARVEALSKSVRADGKIIWK
jgi:hypothetical protein